MSDLNRPVHLRTLDGRGIISIYPQGRPAPPPARVGRYVVSEPKQPKAAVRRRSLRASRLAYKALALLIEVDDKEEALRLALTKLMDEKPERYWKSIELMAAQENLRTDYR